MKYAVAALALALSACGSPLDNACDRVALDAITADSGAEAVLAACPGMPDGLRRALAGDAVSAADLEAKLWTCEADLSEALGGGMPAAEAFVDCGLATEVEGLNALSFAFADGQPVAGAVTSRWLQSVGYPAPDAQRIGVAAAGQVQPIAAVGSAVYAIPGTPAASLNAWILASDPPTYRVDLAGLDTDGRPGMVSVLPMDETPGIGLGGLIDVHLHPDGLLVEHGAAYRKTVALTQAELGSFVDGLVAERGSEVAVRVVPHGVSVDAVMAAAQVLPGPVGLAPADAPCGPAPAGMVCVEGVTSAVDGGTRVISPFLIDVSKASLADYESCVEAGACRQTERRGSGPRTLTDLSWEEGLRYCVWSGKTLPTEWQWEVAEEAGRLDDATSGPAEWTLSGFAEDCGQACLGVDPVGPCGGAEDCEAAPLRSVRGGEGQRGSARRGQAPGSEAHGVRCASPFPTREAVEAPGLAPLTQPSAEVLALFHGSAEDPIELKPLCDGVGGQAHLDCKDPVTYVIGNEPRAHLFMPYIAGLGGGYIGVASDQNYSQAAIAQTRWLWLMDYDPKVVSVHRMNGVFIKESETPEAFVAWYSPGRRAQAQAKVKQALGDDELTALALRNLRVWGDRLHEHYTLGLQAPAGREGIDGKYVPAGRPDFGWLRNPDHYQHIRTLWLQGRVRAVKGDMLGDKGMQGIGKAARAMGVPIRIYYTSNAPFAWGGMMVEAYRENVRSLPMDEHSLLVQTLGSRSGYGQRTYWHHSLVSGHILQRRLGHPGFDHVSKIVYDRALGGDPDLTVIGVAAK